VPVFQQEENMGFMARISNNIQLIGGALHLKL